MMGFVPKPMNFAGIATGRNHWRTRRIMRPCVFQMMNFAVKMMNFVVKMRNSALQMKVINAAARLVGKAGKEDCDKKPSK